MNLVEPPAMESIDDALKRLHDLGALNPDMVCTHHQTSFRSFIF